MKSDKDLYVQFRNQAITYEQLKARVAERCGYAKYTVLDDIKDKLHPSIMEGLKEFKKTYNLLYKGKKEVTVDDLLRPLEDWEVNKKCLRSIQYHHKKPKFSKADLANKKLQR